jgi:hypothetical protein
MSESRIQEVTCSILRTRGAHIFNNLGTTSKNSRCQKREIKFHTEDPQISEATVQNFFAPETWSMGFVNPCLRHLTWCVL